MNPENLNIAKHDEQKKNDHNQGFHTSGFNDNPSFDEKLMKDNSVSFLVIKEDGQIADHNETFSKSLGFSGNELKDSSIFNLLHEKDAQSLKQSFELLLISGYPIHETFIFRKKDGAEILGQLYGQLKLQNDRHQKLFYIVFTDITEQSDGSENLNLSDKILIQREELLLKKNLELKKQNLELHQLNYELKHHVQNFDDLQTRIIDSEMLLKLAFNDINDGVWNWDLTTEHVFYSDRFFTMLGYDPFEFPHILKSWIDLIHHDDLENVSFILNLISQGKLTEFSTEYRIRTKRNDYLWILSKGRQVEKDNAGKPLKILGTNVDISKLKEIELSLKNNQEKLEEQNEEYALLNKKLVDSNKKISKINRQLQDKQAHLNSIFKTVPACIGLVSERIVLFANDYTSLLTGYEIDEIVGHDTRMFYINDEDYNSVYEALYKESTKGSAKSVNTRWKIKNGTILDMYITATSIASETHIPTFTFTALDVTSQRIYEEELLHAKDQAEKAERLKTVFLANMSHELRTPMNGIVGFAEMLQSQINQTKREQYLKIIVNSSKQLLKIISDIVDISKIETSEVETFYTSFSVEGLMKEFHNSYKNYLAARNKSSVLFESNYNLNKEKDIIYSDENKVRQVLNNLLTNAVKFTDEGYIKFGCGQKGNFIEFYVEDTGIGIDASEQELIFESFRQTESPIRKKYGGNGLGLAIAKGLLSALDGKIWVESVLEKGSTFFFSIPLQNQENKQENNMQNTEQEKIWQKCHILIVEDDLICYTLLEEMLEETGIKISHAVTGLEAIRLCRKDNSFDIVLMDMRLPEIDGYEATQRIKEFRSDLAIIAQTAHALSEDRKKCLAVGCNDYMTKPISQESLFKIIAQYLKN